MDLLYFTIGLSMGLLATFFCFRVYTHSKDSMVGCKYISVAGFSMALWSTSGILYDVFQLPTTFLVATGILMFAMVSFLIPFGAIKLVRDNKFNTGGILTTRNFAIYYLSILALLLAYGFMFSPADAALEVNSVMQLMVTVGFVPVTYCFIVLWRRTSKLCWMFFTMFALLIAVSQVMSMYLGGCCGQGSLFASEASCLGYSDLYVEVIPLACSVEAVEISFGYTTIETAGYVLALVALFLLWKTVGSTTPKTVEAAAPKAQKPLK
jgi:hypothetical protein